MSEARRILREKKSPLLTNSFTELLTGPSIIAYIFYNRRIIEFCSRRSDDPMEGSAITSAPIATRTKFPMGISAHVFVTRSLSR